MVTQQGAILLCQRHDGPHLPLLWEFPGGKIDDGESPAEALARELAEELGVESDVGDELADVSHTYPEKSVRIRFFRAEIRGDPRSIVHREVRWVPIERLAEYAVPPANQAVVDMIVGAGPDGLEGCA